MLGVKAGSRLSAEVSATRVPTRFGMCVFGLLIVGAIMLLGPLAGTAKATVINVTADNSSVSRATGARTVYKIGFAAATTLTSSAQAGTGTITIGFPNGTDLTQIFAANITDTTTGLQVGNSCSHSAAGVPPAETCSIFNGSTVHPNDSVTVTLDEVVNPTTTLANPTVSVFTSSETTPVSSSASPKYQVVGQNPITAVTADNSSVSQAAGARTVYKIGFTASPTGGLAGAAGSQITITFPNTTTPTDITQIFSINITDTTTGLQVGNSCSHTASDVNPPVLTCSIFNGSVVNPTDAVLITLDQVTNPGTITNPTVSVSTTSDTAPVSSSASPKYQVVGQNPITAVTADNSSVSQAAGARTVYKIGFTASPTGGLAGAAGSQITITFPNTTTPTDITQIFSINITDTTTGLQIGNSCSHTASDVNPPVLTCSIFNGSVVNPTDAVLITLDQVTNPGTITNPTVSVSTTSDTAPVSSSASPKYQVVGQNPITAVTADNSSVSQAAGARTVYKIGFTASPTGGLAGAAGSQITITFPNTTTPTDITQIFSINITDTTTGLQIGNSCSHTASDVNPPVLTCSIFNGSVVNPTDAVLITLDQVTNPGTITNPTVSVSTTSDPAPVSSSASPNYEVVATKQISATTVGLSNQAPSAAGVTYTVGFTTSSPTGGLAGAAGSQITISLANGTDITHITSINITDTTTGLQVGNSCSHTASGVNPPVLTCSIFNGSTVGPGHGVSATLNGITNPATSGSDTALISTTSDLSPVGGNYSIGGNPPAPTVTSISPTSGPTGGGTAVTVNGTSFTGATVAFGSAPASITSNTGAQMMVIAPPGSGTVDVVVTNAGGKSATSAADQFIYNAGPASPPPASSSPPVVAGASPTTTTSNGAAVSGTVNPESLVTTAFFEYGLDPSDRGPGASTTLYDQSTPPQQAGADTATHTITAPLTGLVPGALYHIRIVATNSAGTTLGPDVTFTTPASPAPAPPVLGKTQDAAPVTGTVFIKTPSGFVRLTGNEQIPSGAEIDALHGSLKITTATTKKGKTQQGTFGGAVFTLTQARGGATNGLATLSLVENAFSGAPSYATCKPHKALDATAASSKTLQLLHASAHGKFRTKGRYSAATVLGTKWTIADRCDGTLTHDITDSVQVNDFVHHKTITLHAGQSYLAKAKP